MSSFYPHNKPPEFAYTTEFLTVGNDWRGASYSNTVYPGLYSPKGNMVVNKALTNLEILLNSARAAELSFLNATGINLENPNASSIFRNINKILNSKETFERGLKYMEELNKIGRIKDEKTHTYRDVSSFFETYLNQELLKLDGRKIVHMTPEQIKQQINDIISNALIRTYRQVKDFIDKQGNRRLMMGDSGVGKAAADISTGEHAEQAVTDMIKVIKELQTTGAFGDYGYLFNIGEGDLLNQVKNLKKQKRNAKRRKTKGSPDKYKEASVTSNYQGNILELITTLVASQLGNTNINNSGLTIKGVHTGQMNQMKADSILLVGRGNIDINKYFKDYISDTQSTDYTSVRAQNVYAIKNFLDRLGDNIEHVIMISDKNLSITANFKGAEAQREAKLRDIGQMLGEFGVKVSTNLINYLANCGPGMVQGECNGEIKTMLQTMIGYFLFDHLEINVGVKASGPNVVNLLNISGMYIPLSVYLEGLLKSIKEVTGNPSSFVNVTIHLSGPTSADSDWTEGVWKDFREQRELDSYLSYKIVKDIASFISGL